MSAVYTFIECPQCGGVFLREYNGRTRSYSCFCYNCGKEEYLAFIEDEVGNPILDKEGKHQYISKSKKGYGCMIIEGISGYRRYHRLTGPIDEEDKKKYLSLINEPDINKDACCLTSWSDAENKLIAVFGKLPETFEEYEEGCK